MHRNPILGMHTHEAQHPLDAHEHCSELGRVDIDFLFSGEARWMEQHAANYTPAGIQHMFVSKHSTLSHLI
jgi:hypothetical protein